MIRLNKCPYPKIEQYAFPTAGFNLDMGCAMNPEPGFHGVDIASSLAEYRADLNGQLPFPDDSVDYIKATHICEHLPNWLGFMDECWRILKGGPNNGMFIAVPRPDHWTAIGDPEHCRFFHPNHFMYLTPFWYYETGRKPWQVREICWCDTEIRVIMQPVKHQEIMDELLQRRDEMRKEAGGTQLFYDAEFKE